MNERLVTEPPQTFREACQWISWYELLARMYNGSGSLGRLDVLLQPYYERDSAAGILTDEEAIFHLACYFCATRAYMQLGGPDEDGKDVTSRLSYLVLEAAHRLRIPANIGVCVGENVDPGCCAAASRSCSRTRAACPSSWASTTSSTALPATASRSSSPASAPTPAATGSPSPAASTPSTTCVKINFGSVFDVAWQEMMADPFATPSVADAVDRASPSTCSRAVRGHRRGARLPPGAHAQGLPRAGARPALPRPHREGPGRQHTAASSSTTCASTARPWPPWPTPSPRSSSASSARSC